MKAFWRRLTGYRQPAQSLTIDLLSDDIGDLTMWIVSLSDAVIQKVGWSRADRIRVVEAINAHALSRMKKHGTVAAENEMQPVTLSKEDWRRVAVIAISARQESGVGKWPGRVALRIIAEGLPEGL